MRVVAGSGNSEDSKDYRQAELDRHLAAMSRFIERARNESGAAPRFTMILRSAASVPAQALVAMKDDLSRAGANAKAILAKLEPEDDLRQFFASLSELSPAEPAKLLIRWARNPRLLDAHEQVTYGETMCWLGDAMRRDADKRNALTLFDDGASEAVRRGQLAFEALWASSAAVPTRHLAPREAARPTGTYEQVPTSAVSPFRPNPQGWPLVRH
ncbi:MAG: hypothetical protein ACREDO_02125 [Methyloceanibacter sp.]